MPRAPDKRPSRRLDSILDACRRHGIAEFEAAELEGVGKGLKLTFYPSAEQVEQAKPVRRKATPRAEIDPDLVERPRFGPEEPIDELDLVAEGREGPVPEERPQ